MSCLLGAASIRGRPLFHFSLPTLGHLLEGGV